MEHWPCRVAGLVVSPSSGFGVIRLVQFHREYFLLIYSSLIGRKVIELIVSNSA